MLSLQSLLRLPSMSLSRPQGYRGPRLTLMGLGEGHTTEPADWGTQPSISNAWKKTLPL